MVAGKKSESWKDLWKAFLDGNVKVEDVVDTAIAEYTEIPRKIIANLNKKSGVDISDHQIFKFCEKARGDLIILTKTEANPAIILRLVFPTMIKVAPDVDEKSEERIKEFNTLSKPDYWKKMISKLERAREDLQNFMDYKIYRDIEEEQMWSDLELKIYPFARICKEVRTTEGIIDRLIQSIRELRLDEGSRKLTYNRPYVSWEPMEASRGPKAGLGERLGWDRPAYGLWKYLEVRTGKQHLRHITRLLHFSGWDFPGVITPEDDPDLDTERIPQEEIDKLHKRIKKLKSDPSVTIQIGDIITKLESHYETRDLLDYGGFLSSPLSIIESDQDSNE